MKKTITNLTRFFVGFIFILSGIVKTIDPIGFSYKLDEYFSETVFNIPFLLPFSLGISTFFVIFEVVLGVFLILGILKKFTLNSLLILIIIFSFLTFYSAYFDKVRSCGCFGDFITLTPWQSFYKDIVLFILILILIININYINPLIKNIKFLNFIAFLTLIITFYIAYKGIFELPVYDFRAYAKGKNLIEGRKSAEELGLKPPKIVTIYTYKNKKTNQEKIINSEELLNSNIWEDENWEIDETKTKGNVILEDGYQAPIPPDFAILCNDSDQTENILNKEKVIIITILKSKNIGVKSIAKIKKLVSELKKYNISTIIVSDTNSIYGVQTCMLDDKVMKTINRSEIGVMVLKKATVIKKYPANEFPDYNQIINLY